MGIGLIARILVLAAGTLVAATFASRGEARAYHVLYSFCAQTNCADGSEPLAGLIMDKWENLYGTTALGGANGRGTVFQLTPGGTETVLYSFCAQTNCADGANPGAALIMDEAGNLYGTTPVGGANDRGTVFELTPSGRETVLYSFCAQHGCADGSTPLAALIMDKWENLYGTTDVGGANDQGTVFELTHRGTETVLYSFCAQTNCADGARTRASLIMDKRGNLYGTTLIGGRNNNTFRDGGGTVFELTPGGRETVLYSFCAQTNCADGALPQAGLIMDKAGNLYGTTVQGGANNFLGGVVFQLTP